MEYVDLVNRIVEVEHSAKEIAREAKQQESSLDQEVQQETAALHEQYMARARRRIEQVEQTEAQAADEAIAQLDEKLAQAMAAVESAYEKNKDRWVDTLFDLIVGGEPC